MTRTSADHNIDDITTDPNPDPSFYELTVAEAIQSGPSVIVFGTPAWCTSQSCGPLLDQVKTLSSDFPDLNYVHVEVYENIHAESREDLILVPSVEEWALPSEPWVFVTGKQRCGCCFVRGCGRQRGAGSSLRRRLWLRA